MLLPFCALACCLPPAGEAVHLAEEKKEPPPAQIWGDMPCSFLPSAYTPSGRLGI